MIEKNHSGLDLGILCIENFIRHIEESIKKNHTIEDLLLSEKLLLRHLMEIHLKDKQQHATNKLNTEESNEKVK